MKTLVVSLALLLGGCATCSEHPVACSAGVAILATSVALSVDHGSHTYGPTAMTGHATTQPINCTGCTQ